MIPALGSLHTGRMALTPVDPLQALDRTTIVTQLRAAGLLGRPLDAPAEGFAIGPSFDSLVAFTGCAVQFDVGAQQQAPAQAAAVNGPWLRVPKRSDAPQLHVGRNTRPPRCPECGAAFRDWRRQLAPCASNAATPIASSTRLRCPACDATTQASHWLWGRHAGAGTSFVWIEEVFPGEAAPLPALLKVLAELGAGPWKHFYVQS